MRKLRFTGKFAAIVLLFMFVVNVTVLVHEVIASAYVRTESRTGTEYSQDGIDWWPIKIPTLQAFAEASATPTATMGSATPGSYSGWATVSATAGDQPPVKDSGVIWIHINLDGKIDSSSGGYYVKATDADENASTSASAGGYLYGN